MHFAILRSALPHPAFCCTAHSQQHRGSRTLGIRVPQQHTHAPQEGESGALGSPPPPPTKALCHPPPPRPAAVECPTPKSTKRPGHAEECWADVQMRAEGQRRAGSAHNRGTHSRPSRPHKPSFGSDFRFPHLQGLKHSVTRGGGFRHVGVLFSSAAGGAYWPIAICCPSLGPFPSVGSGAYRPLTALCPSSPSLAYPSLSTSLSFPLVGCANAAPGLSPFPCSVSGPHGGGHRPSPRGCQDSKPPAQLQGIATPANNQGLRCRTRA